MTGSFWEGAGATVVCKKRNQKLGSKKALISVGVPFTFCKK